MPCLYPLGEGLLRRLEDATGLVGPALGRCLAETAAERRSRNSKEVEEEEGERRLILEVPACWRLLLCAGEREADLLQQATLARNAPQ